jgi:hypothetical protein
MVGEPAPGMSPWSVAWWKEGRICRVAIFPTFSCRGREWAGAPSRTPAQYAGGTIGHSLPVFSAPLIRINRTANRYSVEDPEHPKGFIEERTSS